MSEAELTELERSNRFRPDPEVRQTIDRLIAELRQWRALAARRFERTDEAIAVAFSYRDDVLRLSAENAQLREALEEITRLGQGHLLTTAVDLARRALRPPATS